MNEPIPRRLYPATRDEQAMRRFMLGTLNVGHNMTFQRKSMIVNVSPQHAEREILTKFFDSLGVHRTERCYNIKLTIHATPVADNLRLSRESEYNCFPYNHAEVTLTPANAISEVGKKRNMHMQTHEILQDAPTVNVYGVGYRKGEVAMLQFVKDCVTFRQDLERDDAETAARLLRPFISAAPLNATEQLMQIPAHPTMTIRDLFDSQPDQAPTPSDVAARAQSAVAALLYPALQPHQLLAPTQQNRTVETTSGTAAPFPHIVPARTLMQIRRKTPNNVQSPPTSHPPISDRIRRPSNASNEAALHNVIGEGMRAAKIIFPREAGSTTTLVPFPLSKMPDTKHFLDYERCREVLRNANLSHVDFFNAWQAHRESVLQPVRLGTHNKDVGSSDDAVQPDDSGVVMTETLQAQSAAHEVAWDHFALQMISPERPHQPHASAASTENESSRNLPENENTPTLRAASTLLSLSPIKPSNQKV